MNAERRYGLPRTRRITRRADFDGVMRTGVRVVDGRIAVWGLRNGLPLTRLGVTVGRKHGGAVQRNRLKRLLREAFRLSQHELPAGFDFVCAPRAGVDVDLPGLQESLSRLARRLGRQLRES